MKLIDADKFLGYLIVSKHIDGLTCGEVKRAVEICKVDVDDCVSRQVVKEQMLKYGFRAPDMTVTEFVEDLPPVLPKHERNDKE